MNLKLKFQIVIKHTYAIMSVMVVLSTLLIISNIRFSEAQGGTVNWTDGATLNSQNPVRFIHVNEIRTVVNQRRTGCAASDPCGLSNYNFGSNLNSGDTISNSHVNDLRQAISQLKVLYYDPAPSNISGTVATGTQIRAQHLNDLRAAIENAEYCGDGICQDKANGNSNDGQENNADCPADCIVVPTCTDNIQNQGETGIDCGGPCPPCATCTDSIQNQGETGVDCGGPCPPCPPGCADTGDCNVDSDCCSGNCVDKGAGFSGSTCEPSPGNCGPAPHYQMDGVTCRPSCGVQLALDGLSDSGSNGCCQSSMICGGNSASVLTWDCQNIGITGCCENGGGTPGCIPSGPPSACNNNGICEPGIGETRDISSPDVCGDCFCGDNVCENPLEHCDSGSGYECQIDCYPVSDPCAIDDDCMSNGTVPSQCLGAPCGDPVWTCEFDIPTGCGECQQNDTCWDHPPGCV